MYAKGLIALNLIPGEDTLTVIGCTTIEAVCLFAACSAVGIGFSVKNYVNKLASKIALVHH